MTTQADKLFGKIAVVNGILTQSAFDAFLEECDSDADETAVPLKMIMRGIISRKQFDAIAKVHKYQAEKLSLSVPAGFYDLSALGVEESASEDAPAPGAHVEQARIEVAGDSRPFYTLSMPEDRFIAQGIRAYLKLARSAGASDIHISSGVEPFIRLHGRIIYIRQKPLEPETAAKLLEPILTPEQKRRLDEEWDLDFGWSDPELGRFRVNCCKQRHGLMGCFRMVEEKIPTIEELGLPSSIANFTTHHQGIVLITGTAGSGKSTTMAALVNLINKSRKDHIIAIEEPIEFVHKSALCNITQREVRRHTKDFHFSLRACLREDPDVIVVGEMRDLETISMAITAAETGHLVFATLHTTNATRTVDRILDVFPPKEQAQIRAMVSESLRGVVSQQLIPRADGRGRIPAVEILVATPAVANMIREYKTFQLPSVIQTGKQLGMIAMDDSLRDLLDRGLITLEEARYRSENPSRFQ
jgi:twitching motility protein PilT